METIDVKQTVDTIEKLVMSIKGLPEGERIHVYDKIADYACRCLEMAESLSKPKAIVSENLERLLHSCRCLARIEEDSHSDDAHIIWALGAINTLKDT